MNLAILILAAGLGKRMKSSQPKVLHLLCGQSLLEWVLETCYKLNPTRIVIVIGPNLKKVLESLDDKIETVVQEKQWGTGHAVSLTQSKLASFPGPLLIACGDTPLITVETLQEMVEVYQRETPAAIILTATVKEPFGYGRILQEADGSIQSIVEEKDATEAERKISQVNAGTYIFNPQKLFPLLKKLTNKNKQGEFYLTDVIALLKDEGEKILAVSGSEEEILGVNSRWELAKAEAILEEKIKRRHMDEGVTFINPQTSFVEAKVSIGQDTIVYPYSILEGKSIIGSECLIGPQVRIIQSQLGKRVKAQYAVVRESLVEDDVEIGPFCSLRPGTIMRKRSKAGTFVEIKESEIGQASKVPHLSYMGDATIGRKVNVGAGSITCNFDGIKKYHTLIEDEAFIGSDTMLIAPLKVGKGSVTAASSAINKDVPPGSLAIERCSQKNIVGWVKKRQKKLEEKRQKKE